MLITQNPFPQFFDTAGKPLTDGRIYFGVAGQNPRTSPVAIYTDAAGTQPIAQPVRTLGGYPVRNGSPVNIFTPSTYSVAVYASTGTLVAYAPDSAAFDSVLSATTAFTRGLLGAPDAATARATLGAASLGANTFTGALTLPGNAVNALEAVPKQQAETIAASAATSAVANRMQYSLTPSQATTSGSAIDFTGIPSWAKRLTLMLNGVSTNGSSAVAVQIGDGAIVSAGYAGSAGYTGAASAAGVMVNAFATETATGSGVIRHGHCTLTHLGGNVWIFSSVQGRSESNYMHIAGGSKTLAGVLDRIRLTTVSGTDAFDAGSVSLLIEG